ncbi:DUF929 domain-containing protein [Sulfuracidifex tepidarius]|uniref:DUF929 domain-containing protein n=2 Tax=Sulfuracidifex tepidarius TaxID=1294262 RepID=A0A510E6T9_9CREN|nr:DUF929 domain-containing protein [Sulfuracidifex tepidarius]BBG25467.1 hypothetical protein IC006_2803 [Sulfuracidifex tepidarius]BBG28261.1 hypothetical protein IC007_2817 [Sulfuracidifex tepidarius]
MAKRKNNVKTKNKKQDSKLIYIPFIVLGVLIVALIGFTSFSHPVFSPSSSFSSSPAPFKFFQVNTQNYAGNDSVQVFFISWYGCPYGATDSWALYKTLSQYGNIQATPGHSISEPNIPYIPSLWFTSFKPNSSVYFHYLYMYNEYLNATPSGIPINPENGSAVIVGLQEIKDNLSYAPWIYNIIEQYEVDTPLVSSSSGLNDSIAYSTSAPHIATMIIITGPGGTYALIGYPTPAMNPDEIGQNSASAAQNYSENLLSQLKNNDITDSNVNTMINEGSQVFNYIISKAQ